jgi:hypothetical protein
MAGGTVADVEALVDSYQSLHDTVVSYGVRSGMFTEAELREIYEEKAIFGLCGTALAERLSKRVKVD